jgi:hypothetical protein
VLCHGDLIGDNAAARSRRSAVACRLGCGSARAAGARCQPVHQRRVRAVPRRLPARRHRLRPRPGRDRVFPVAPQPRRPRRLAAGRAGQPAARGAAACGSEWRAVVSGVLGWARRAHRASPLDPGSASRTRPPTHAEVVPSSPLNRCTHLGRRGCRGPSEGAPVAVPSGMVVNGVVTVGSSRSTAPATARRCSAPGS